MADKIVIPMIVLAHHLKNPLPVPVINPNYKTVLKSYLGKDGTPAAFNTNLLLKKGVHLHFILPSVFKKGQETTDERGGKTIEYPAVPDRYIVTRMYVKNSKIRTDCHIVESNFCSLDDTYSDSITIPKFDDLRTRRRFRYMGRSYSAMQPVPDPVGESGYLDKITAMGAGDPMFSAYYPSCSSVFGFYDSLEGVPADAVLTYVVMGLYSDPANDIFHGVTSADNMKEILANYNLSVVDGTVVCQSCMLLGVVGGIDLTKEHPVPVGEINIGIGKSSAEALSAIISEKYYKGKEGMERLLTSIQYDTADEAMQPDGNFKIDDDIHYRGFSRIDPIEKSYAIKLSKDLKKTDAKEMERQYFDLIFKEREIGRKRRLLEYKKNSLYYLWEIYEGASTERAKEIIGYMEPLMEEIGNLRKEICAGITNADVKKSALERLFSENEGEMDGTSCEPFYLPKDPAVMLFGEGMNRTYAFGEDGRFEDDNTLSCLTKPLTADITEDKILECFADLSYISGLWDEYREYLVSAVLLDTVNLQQELDMHPVISDKVSPIVYNGDPTEQVMLLMQWESVFFPDYTDADPKESVLLYGDTDYVYQGARSEHGIHSEGVAVLTPHGVYNLQDKLKKYLACHSDSKEIAMLAGQIKDLAAISQSLGGFSIDLCALAYAYQFPIDIDPKDEYSQKVADCISPAETRFYEPAAERLAVRDNSQIFPLREGYFGLSKLAIVSTFGEQRKIIDDELAFKGKRYISENLQPVRDNLCFFPLMLTSAVRLLTYFVTAHDRAVISTPFPGASPVIGIFLPDMLNRNLNVFSGDSVSIGVLKTAYRKIDGKKTAVGRFIKSPDAPATIDPRIGKLIAVLTQDNSAFAEVMEAIDTKLNTTLPLSQNHFIFGRALVLAEVAVELEYYGAPEWSKKNEDIGRFDDVGLSKQEFPVMFGDRNRTTDGVCCGFTQDFTKGFAAFGMERQNAKYLNAPPFVINGSEGVKHVALLFDPMLKVTVNTGILPVKQLEICGEHVDFSEYELCAAELNTVISQQTQAQLPDFAKGKDYSIFYPKDADSGVVYEELKISNTAVSIGEIGETMVTDGMIVERR